MDCSHQLLCDYIAGQEDDSLCSEGSCPVSPGWDWVSNGLFWLLGLAEARIWNGWCWSVVNDWSCSFWSFDAENLCISDSTSLAERNRRMNPLLHQNLRQNASPNANRKSRQPKPRSGSRDESSGVSASRGVMWCEMFRGPSLHIYPSESAWERSSFILCPLWW